MGVVNVTPDSFSDGGINFRAEDAIASARRMVDEGAAIVDVGGESTRPGSEGVSLDEELRRVIPVLEALAGMPVSIDTAKAEVAHRAVELGAELVNDVTALRGDPDLAGVVADAGAYLCLMHMRGEPRTMQENPRYDDVAAEVAAFLEERLAFAVGQGIPEERICLDPGIGFGKIGRAQRRARPQARRAARARPAGGDRLLAQALVGTDARRPGRDRGIGLREPRRGRRGLRARRDDPARARRPRDRRGAHGRGGAAVIVELHGLEVFGRHGVLEEEKLDGQTFVYDVELEVDEPASDRIDDAVDYRLVADCVQEVSDSRSFDLIESLAASVADELVGRLAVSRVRVRVRKPRPAGVPAEWSAATAERRR